MGSILDAALDKAAADERDYEEHEARRPHRERVFTTLILDIRAKMIERNVPKIRFQFSGRNLQVTRFVRPDGYEEMRCVDMAWSHELTIRRYGPGLIFNRHPKWEVVYARGLSSFAIKGLNEALNHALRASASEE